MTSSSSSSSRSASRRQVYGVPTLCWCGKGLITWVSETKENPHRRFYRCEIALQVFNFKHFFLHSHFHAPFGFLTVRKTENHLFKWVDEALLEEVRMVDAKIVDLVHDFHSLSKRVIEELNAHKLFIAALDEDVKLKLTDNITKMSQAIDEATLQFKEDFAASIKSNTKQSQFCINPPIHNIAVAVVIVGAITALYCKLF
ncbi:hypothetical protein N665_1194s0008 [Sinapis alba]|nr:hypothetical protein N665_1194s0008 [Sinapis alba]